MRPGLFQWKDVNGKRISNYFAAGISVETASTHFLTCTLHMQLLHTDAHFRLLSQYFLSIKYTEVLKMQRQRKEHQRPTYFCKALTAALMTSCPTHSVSTRTSLTRSIWPTLPMAGLEPSAGMNWLSPGVSKQTREYFPPGCDPAPG